MVEVLSRLAALGTKGMEGFTVHFAAEDERESPLLLSAYRSLFCGCSKYIIRLALFCLALSNTLLESPPPPPPSPYPPPSIVNATICVSPFRCSMRREAEEAILAALHERFGGSFSDGVLERQRDRRVKGWSNSEKKTEWQVRGVVWCGVCMVGMTEGWSDSEKKTEWQVWYRRRAWSLLPLLRSKPHSVVVRRRTDQYPETVNEALVGGLLCSVLACCKPRTVEHSWQAITLRARSASGCARGNRAVDPDGGEGVRRPSPQPLAQLARLQGHG